ncbi:YcxB family protein [Huintestinicola sp.]|uniref:YcxB family protein n=1 Tax=Huintestinicola sp. TaxID=2981661 RepID=UPI003D7E4AF0
MNDVIYEFESEIKYRQMKPKQYLAILIIGLLISVPRLLLSVVVIISYLLIRTEIVQSDIQFITVYFLIFFFLPLIIFIGTIKLFRAKALLKFTFRNEAVDILIVPKKRTVTVPYSNITAVRSNSLCYFFYTSKNLAYLLSKEAMGNVSNEEFSEFILEHMGIKVIELIERK